MKIIYTGAFLFPTGDPAAARVLNNAKIMRDLGHTIKFIAWGSQNNLEAKSGEYAGFEYLISGDLNTGSTSILKRFVESVFRGKKSLELIEKEEPDVIIIYNSHYYFSRLLKRYCVKHNTYLISDITEWYSSKESIGGFLSPLYWLWEYNMRYYQRKIPNKILISSYLFNYYQGQHNLLLPPLVDLSENKWRKEVQIDSTKLSKHKGVRVIYAGNPKHKDNLRCIIDALSDIVSSGNRSIQLLLLGLSEKSLFQYVTKDEFNQLGDNLINIGYINQDDVPSYYSISDASLIIREFNRKSNAGFPTKMAESMAAGCPVVMTNTSDLKKYAIDGKSAIIINECSREFVKDALLKFAKLTSNQIVDFKKLASQIGKDSFDYRNYLDQTQNFLDRLVKL